ncbi:MAG TPA: MogA/MoaB family molybdenum cofactor biosynthesis protein [Candidatus Binataceae bacterium]|nr:MogA/MoaB family molybdenum cofactor biosynthesis protein [Candidatus Binataceae bacterium]
MSAHEHHRHGAHTHLKVAVITASDSRTPETDESGGVIRSMLERAGHAVVHYEVVPDSPDQIRQAVMDRLPAVDAIIINGGTGISARDNTIEAIRPLLSRELEGFGELFRMLSYQEIGSAAFLSRAVAGVVHRRIVVALPGSPDACRLAMDKLLIPELGHMAHVLKQ